MALEFDTVKSFLRIDHDADDKLIHLFMNASKSFVESYLNRQLSDFGDSYPEEFDIAMLYIIQQWYDQRAITSFTKGEKDGLDLVFSTILDKHRYRKFTFLGYPVLNERTLSFSYNYSKSDIITVNEALIEQVDTITALTQ